MNIGIQNMTKVFSYNPSSPVCIIETIPSFQSPQPCASPSSLINVCKEKKDNEEQEGFSAPTKMRFPEANKIVSAFEQNTKNNETKD